ncbi:hypothetical protein [Minwuia sp.]|uniref:hypothetical protein n=1 Tax=Minwuia sp. TaxID=2493630 RepID=UPI003A8DD846
MCHLLHFSVPWPEIGYHEIVSVHQPKFHNFGRKTGEGLILADREITVHIAAGEVSGSPPIQRTGKASQRRVAARCQAILHGLWPDSANVTTSVSHSRGRVVVATTSHCRSGLGIDIEYADPGRNWPGILDLLVPACGTASDCHHGALIWTAYEAFFKANGHFPTLTQIQSVARRARQMADDQSTHAVYPLGSSVILSTWMPVDVNFAIGIALPSKLFQPGSARIGLVWHFASESGYMDNQGTTKRFSETAIQD